MLGGRYFRWGGGKEGVYRGKISGIDCWVWICFSSVVGLGGARDEGRGARDERVGSSPVYFKLGICG